MAITLSVKFIEILENFPKNLTLRQVIKPAHFICHVENKEKWKNADVHKLYLSKKETPPRNVLFHELNIENEHIPHGKETRNQQTL